MQTCRTCGRARPMEDFTRERCPSWRTGRPRRPYIVGRCIDCEETATAWARP